MADEAQVAQSGIEQFLAGEKPAEPAGEQEQQQQQQAPQPAPELVPIHALHEARLEARELKGRLMAAEQRLQTVDELKAAILAMKQRERQAEIPEFAENPLGHLAYRLQQAEQQLAQQTQQTQQQNMMTQEQLQAQAQAQQIQRATAAYEAEFAKAKPDYYDAVNYLTQKRISELQLFGIYDPQTIQQDIAKNVQGLALTAMNAGKNPAEVAYQLAFVSGYKPKQPPSGQMQQGQPPAGAFDVNNLSLRTVQQGMTAAQTLGGPSEVKPDPTVEALLKAEGAEFDAMWKKIFPET